MVAPRPTIPLQPFTNPKWRVSLKWNTPKHMTGVHFGPNYSVVWVYAAICVLIAFKCIDPHLGLWPSNEKYAIGKIVIQQNIWKMNKTDNCIYLLILTAFYVLLNIENVTLFLNMGYFTVSSSLFNNFL